MRALIRQGVGIHAHVWPLDQPLEADGGGSMAATILAWVKQTMAAMRRPYGIDHVVLALGCRDGAGRLAVSNATGVLWPGDFYSATGEERIAAFLADVEAIPPEGRAELVATLLSLGDMAYALDVAPAR